MEITEEKAAQCLANNKVRVYPKEKEIVLDRQVGIKLLGVIDCLKNYYGYKVTRKER